MSLNDLFFALWNADLTIAVGPIIGLFELFFRAVGFAFLGYIFIWIPANGIAKVIKKRKQKALFEQEKALFEKKREKYKNYR